MPLLSFIKRLVSAEEIPAVQQQQQQQQHNPASPEAATDNALSTATEAAEATETINASEEQKQPLPPPPPLSASFKRSLPPTSTASMTSLRSRVELERKAASSTSIYTDFTSGGHADAGHWNDPPTTVFKKQSQRPKPAADTVVTPSEIGGSDASSFMVIENRDEEDADGPADPMDPVPEDCGDQILLIKRVLHGAVDAIDLADAAPMVRRMVEDTTKRLALMDDRLDSVDGTLVAAVCSIALLVDSRKLNAAANAHRDLLQAETHTSELKWLVGIKRVIELLQKN
ncbi:hypothetical protein LPJ74_004868 [Coemansia sp. RSA 1843]|nr:hypothetical protein LPJ74_004868 [Coemansia sp. RSA 1843]